MKSSGLLGKAPYLEQPLALRGEAYTAARQRRPLRPDVHTCTFASHQARVTCVGLRGMDAGLRGATHGGEGRTRPAGSPSLHPRAAAVVLGVGGGGGRVV